MSTPSSIYKNTPRQIMRFVERILRAGHVPFIKSSPGMGKSAIMRAVAKKLNLKVIDIRLSTCTPTDLTGLPHFRGTIAEFVPFDMFPIADTPLPINPETGIQYDGWLIFFDEFNSALKSVQAAAYKVVYDKLIGLHSLHERCVIAAAGNLTTDRAIVNPLSTAMQSRVITLEMELEPNEFMADVAIPFGWDDRIISYLAMNPDHIHDFRPEHNENTFCCPRTWEFVNDLIRGYDYKVDADGNYQMDEDAPLLAGAITSGVATSFITFTRVFSSLPAVASILGDPMGAPIPSDRATQFALMMMLVNQANDNTFENLADYINRLNSEFRVLFFRTLMIRKPELRSHKAFRSAMLTLAKYLHD